MTWFKLSEGKPITAQNCPTVLNGFFTLVFAMEDLLNMPLVHPLWSGIEAVDIQIIFLRGYWQY